MADTAQSVVWLLEYGCPFRKGEAVTDIGAGWGATAPLKNIDDAERRNDVFGDLAVTSTLYSGGTKSPGNGFRISEAAAAAGDLGGARRTCGTCPANAFLPAPGGMAGCCGRLSFDPDAPDLEKALRRAASAPDAAALFTAAFPRTTPIWYGLWIDSPLSRAQLRALRALAPNVPLVDAADGPDLAAFDRACEISLRHDIPLRVQLSPLGHTDFGFYTTFPHCPRCKKHTGERWEKNYSARQTTCRTCGHAFVPADTAGSERMGDGDDPNGLERQLPPAEYEALVAEWRRRHASDPPTPLERMFAEMGINSGPGAFGKAAVDEPHSVLTRWWRRLWGR